MKIDDTKRLDWLEQHFDGGALLSDDRGHWALSMDGFQNVPLNAPDDVQTSFFIAKNEWKPSIREAIDVHLAAAKQ